MAPVWKKRVKILKIKKITQQFPQPQKNPINPKNPPKKPVGLGFCKKKRDFSTLSLVDQGPTAWRYMNRNKYHIYIEYFFKKEEYRLWSLSLALFTLFWWTEKRKANPYEYDIFTLL